MEAKNPKKAARKEARQAARQAERQAAQAERPEMRTGPFFIIGCVRSGTTMLRDVLRRHPNLAAPEETHLFRWTEPFGTEAYARGISSNPVLKRHRAMDGISEPEFAAMLRASGSRADLYHRYMKLFIERNKPGATRWFDKTPQNVYGAAMISASMPVSRFVHIVRDPVNVVASLRIGKVMKVERLTGAVNYWREAIDIISVLKRANPRRVHELRYEDFVRDTEGELRRLLDFLGEPYEARWFEDFRANESDHADSGVLKPEEIEAIERLAIAGRRRYGYAPPAPESDAAPEDDGEAGA
jgi:hypothetical protein